MAKKKDTNKTENTSQGFPARNWGETHSEILEGLCRWINMISDDILDTTSDELCEFIEGRKKEHRRIDWSNLYWVPWSGIGKINRFCGSVSYNSKKVYKSFKGTEAFPVILEALGVLLRFKDIGDQTFKNHHRSMYFQGFSKQQVIGIFGEEALKHYEPDRKLTKDDYKIILEVSCKYLDFLQESESKKRLYDLAARLTAYKKYFLDPIDPKESESQFAKWQEFLLLNKSARNKLTDTEENILEALGNDTLRGQELLKKAGYDFSSHYRGILSNLVKRGILKKTTEGYQKI